MSYSEWDYIQDCIADEQESIDEYIRCKHAYGVPAYRSYGSNLPDNCQGCVFPGDEAHVNCELTKDECDEWGCPFGPGFWHRRCPDSSTEEAARALFGKAS